MSKVLITGGNGLIGTRLQQMLLQNGHDIHIVGRKAAQSTNLRIKNFVWDVENASMDKAALEGVEVIIHLAGAGVADGRWTDARKKEIMDSRIDSTRLLYNTLSTMNHDVQVIVSASAVGYYGDQGAKVLTEDDEPGQSFLAEVVVAWENAVEQLEKLAIRHVCCRIGVVLSKNGGALPELEKTIPVGIAGYFAKDDLYYSWVHIDDVCGIMLHALEHDRLRGSYNTTAPNPVLIKDLMKAIVKAKKAHALLTPVPPIALKLVLGEMSDVVLQSQRCSDAKLKAAGYKFIFPTLAAALGDIYK